MAKVGGFSTGNSSIILNVYDLHENNDIFYPWGLGFYHSGVQIGREEYTFGEHFVACSALACLPCQKCGEMRARPEQAFPKSRPSPKSLTRAVFSLSFLNVACLAMQLEKLGSSPTSRRCVPVLFLVNPLSRRRI